MQRLWETILGLDKGFLGEEGELTLQFNPHWPGQQWVGAGLWNFVLAILIALLVLYVYRREGRTTAVRITLGIVRTCLLALVLMLLNRPVLTLGQSRIEPSVLAVLIDDSISMRVRDAGEGPDKQPMSRLEAAIDLLDGQNRRLLKDLTRQHVVKLYRFGGEAQQMLTTDKDVPNLRELLEKLQPDDPNTQVLGSVRTVLDDLQGQRLAGVVVLTDGRDTPARPLAEALAPLKDYGVKVYPVSLGSDKLPTNIDVQSVAVQDSAFKGDIVNVKVTLRGTGYESGHAVTLVVKDKKTGKALSSLENPTGETRVILPDDKPVEAEVQFKPQDVGTLDLVVEAVKQPGELDDQDNTRFAQVAVLDAKITLLYVDGYPRWDYRYVKNQMIRDKTVDISCLLTSADPTFAQEGDKPIKRFPESIEEMMQYDVVIFGDVDPRQFTDAQLQLVSDFVSKRGGGFGMVAGPKWSPVAFRNSAIEPILPVNISRADSDDTTPILQGFRPVLTTVGSASSIFRFFADKQQNEKFLRDDLQPLFWYCRGVTVKSGVGEVYAEHPIDTGPDGRKSPILVLGRFGAGRTLFSAIDDSWRWRFYTGESIFDTYWVQQIRYLARSKKLGQRRLTLTSLRPSYELGEQVRISLRILDPQLSLQLPEQIGVQVTESDKAEGSAVLCLETLMRQEGQSDLYVLSYTADRIGKFVVRLPPIAGGVDALEVPIEVNTPRLELAQPQVDRTLLSRLASQTLGQTVEYAEAREKLPALIPSAAKVIPIETSQPLWDAPLAMVLFVGLITLEWVMRKMFGML